MSINFRERLLSSFPLSIGTGLAFEALFNCTMERYDNNKEIPARIDLAGYDVLVLNANTLLRNIINATKNTGNVKTVFYYRDLKKHGKLIKELQSAFESEIYAIKQLCDVQGITPVLHCANYEPMLRGLSETRARFSRSQLHIEEEVRTRDVLKLVDDSIFKIMDGYKTKYAFDNSLLDKRCIVFTHVSYDLFNKTKGMIFLESNTGASYKRPEFYRRYKKVDNEDMSGLPWSEVLLYILGDKGFVRAIPIKARRKILEISVDKKWTPYTKDTKIKSDMGVYPELVGALDCYKTYYGS